LEPREKTVRTRAAEFFGVETRSKRTQSAAVDSPARPVVPDDAREDHAAWLRGLDLADRCAYDRAFGAAWLAGHADDKCREIARAAVERNTL